ncbi:MAG: glycerophosphodiester phosphodiesterase [Blastocatellia bacterium]
MARQTNITQHRPLVIAHRGASAVEPENTLRAFETAMRMGAEMIELDLQLTRDGRVIVLHDETLDRTTSLKGRADQMAFADIRKADAGKGERVPSLEETLELTRGHCRLYLEIKDARAGAETVRIVRRMGLTNAVMIASFEIELMRQLGRDIHDIELGIIIGNATLDPRVRWRESFPWLAFRHFNYQVLSVRVGLCFSGLARRVRQAGKRLYVWTADTEQDYARMTTRGVDGICTNIPDKLIRWLDQRES